MLVWACMIVTTFRERILNKTGGDDGRGEAAAEARSCNRLGLLKLPANQDEAPIKLKRRFVKHLIYGQCFRKPGGRVAKYIQFFAPPFITGNSTLLPRVFQIDVEYITLRILHPTTETCFPEREQPRRLILKLAFNCHVPNQLCTRPAGSTLEFDLTATLSSIFSLKDSHCQTDTLHSQDTEFEAELFTHSPECCWHLIISAVSPATVD